MFGLNPSETACQSQEKAKTLLHKTRALLESIESRDLTTHECEITEDIHWSQISRASSAIGEHPHAHMKLEEGAVAEAAYSLL